MRHRIVPVSSSNSAWMSCGHEVVGRVSRPPVDVVLEERVVGELVLAELARLAGFAAQIVSSLWTRTSSWSCLGDAEQHADHLHRHPGAEVGHEVEPVGPDERIEHLGAALPDLRLERVHLLRREDPGQQAAVGGVDRAGPRR